MRIIIHQGPSDFMLLIIGGAGEIRTPVQPKR